MTPASARISYIIYGTQCTMKMWTFGPLWTTFGPKLLKEFQEVDNKHSTNCGMLLSLTCPSLMRSGLFYLLILPW